MFLATTFNMTNVEGTHTRGIDCRNQVWTAISHVRNIYIRRKKSTNLFTQNFGLKVVSFLYMGFSMAYMSQFPKGLLWKKSNSLLQDFPLTTTFDDHFFNCIFGLDLWLKFEDSRTQFAASLRGRPFNRCIYFTD